MSQTAKGRSAKRYLPLYSLPAFHAPGVFMTGVVHFRTAVDLPHSYDGVLNNLGMLTYLL